MMVAGDKYKAGRDIRLKRRAVSIRMEGEKKERERGHLGHDLGGRKVICIAATEPASSIFSGINHPAGNRVIIIIHFDGPIVSNVFLARHLSRRRRRRCRRESL